MPKIPPSSRAPVGTLKGLGMMPGKPVTGPAPVRQANHPHKNLGTYLHKKKAG